MMSYFEALGRGIEERWRQKDYDELALAELAEVALRAEPVHAHVEPLAPLVWLQSATSLPSQFDLPARFGQPPVTVFRQGNLMIDVYYWMNGTTTIHEHAFSGAFQVLAGSAVHVEYAFSAFDRVNSHIKLGETVFKNAEVLKVGDTRRILPGDRFAHALFHLEQPSVTVVVRTVEQSELGRQFNYLRPHVAVDPMSAARNAVAVRRIQALRVLRERDPASCYSNVLASTTHADFETFFLVVRECPLQLLSLEQSLSVLEAARPRFGERVDLVKAVLEHEASQAAVIGLRRTTNDLDTRFFLALLANAPDRGSVVALVQRRFPDKDPAAMISRWLVELPGLWAPPGEALSAPAPSMDGHTGRLLVEYLRERTPGDIRLILEATT
jgi:hypothetical protein